MGTVTKARQDEITESLARLREELASVDVIYTDVTHVSRSGMFRCIRPFIVVPGPDAHPWDLTYLVARAGIGKASQRHGGIEMNGCGMNMSFLLVYEIGRAVIAGEPWACRGERCPSNDHVNAPRMPTGPDVIHTGEGGYRFRQVAL